MKKNLKSGFTLTEAVITMTIIGVVSALLLPMANKFRPDPVKVKYLQTYDAITYVASQLANDSAKFGMYERISLNGTPTNISVQNTPFFNRADKFCKNFIEGVNAPSGASCTGNNQSSVSEFTTNNGTAWNVSTSSNVFDNGNASYTSRIKVALDGNMNGSQVFNFIVSADGQTHIADTKGLAYHATRSSWKNTDDKSNNYIFNEKIYLAKLQKDLVDELKKNEAWKNAFPKQEDQTEDENTQNQGGNTEDEVTLKNDPVDTNKYEQIDGEIEEIEGGNIITGNDDGPTTQRPDPIVNDTGDTTTSTTTTTTTPTLGGGSSVVNSDISCDKTQLGANNGKYTSVDDGSVNFSNTNSPGSNKLQ